MTNTSNQEKDQALVEVERALARVQAMLTNLHTQVQLLSHPADGICPILYRDHFLQIALPFVNSDVYQSRIACSRSIPDPVLFTQLFDLIPNLHGKSIIDVGAFTGLQGMLLRHVLAPSHLYLVEPLEVVRPYLEKTIAANADGCEVTLIQAIIDDGESKMAGATAPPGKMAESSYLRQADGEHDAISIDSLNIPDVGLIAFDIPSTKIYALRGAKRTLEEKRPAVLVNLLARDANEMKEFMAGISYVGQRAGTNSVLFLPE